MPTASLTLDTLEAELAARIDAYATGYREQALPRASLEPGAVARLQKEQTLLSEQCAQLAGQLAELDGRGEHETGRLHMNFEPLLQRLRLYGESLRISAQLAALSARLDREIAEVREACVALAKQFLPTHLPRFEQGLESFRDRCDQVADELDALEAGPHDISGLIPLYEQWLAWVERLGEILDERTEALIVKPALMSCQASRTIRIS